MIWRSHYKNDQPFRGTPCLFCQTDTQTRTTLVHVAYGVHVWLCRDHAPAEFRASRTGRDFYHSLFTAWQSAQRLTPLRLRALDALAREAGWRSARAAAEVEVVARPRPGSYHWPYVRKLIEEACSKGVTSVTKLLEIAAKWLSSELRRGRIGLPSRRTVRRWRQERRWADEGWVSPAAYAARPAD